MTHRERITDISAPSFDPCLLITSYPINNTSAQFHLLLLVLLLRPPPHRGRIVLQPANHFQVKLP